MSVGALWLRVVANEHTYTLKDDLCLVVADRHMQGFLSTVVDVMIRIKPFRLVFRNITHGDNQGKVTGTV